MAMPLDLKGRFVEYTIDMGGTTTATANGQANGQVFTNQLTHDSVLVFNSGLVPTGPPWVFTYLKYVPGAVTVAPLQGPVMTGPLSGCFVFRYRDNGQEKIAHVGTAHSPTDAATIAVKAAWRALIAPTTVNNITGSSPASCILPKDYNDARIKAHSGGTPIIVGYYTQQESYAMLVTPVPQNNLPQFYKGRNLLRIGAVTRMNMQSWATIRVGPKFYQAPPARPSKVGRPTLTRV